MAKLGLPPDRLGLSTRVGPAEDRGAGKGQGLTARPCPRAKLGRLQYKSWVRPIRIVYITNIYSSFTTVQGSNWEINLKDFLP